jgi:type IV pilus assembly protein PilB
LRIATLPTVNGEKIVMRLLPKSNSAPTLSDLGLRGTALKNFEENITKPHGIILITGPTGSGKTTTLFATLSKINSPKVNIVTLEDPVEYQIPGINQVQINIQAGLTFASGLRSFLRQDPNVIMVGEIRDGETADLAIQASLTGHLVFSTLHTNSAAGSLPRLLDMGAETFLLASSINCVVAQRVVRKICLKCKEEFVPPSQVMDDMKKTLGNLLNPKHIELSKEEEKDLSELHDTSKIKLYRGKGCDDCGDSGYQGRIAIFEVLPINEKNGRLILERAPAGKIEEQAVEDGMVKLIQDGYLKALEGLTTIEEVLRVAKE